MLLRNNIFSLLRPEDFTIYSLLKNDGIDVIDDLEKQRLFFHMFPNNSKYQYLDNTYVGPNLPKSDDPIRPRMTASRNHLRVSHSAFSAIQKVLIQNPYNPDKLKELRSEFAALLKKED